VKNDNSEKIVLESSQDENLHMKGNNLTLNEGRVSTDLSKVRTRADLDHDSYDAEIVEDLGDSYKIKVCKDGKFHLGVVFKDAVGVHHKSKKIKRN
jgi:hypothetical protein